MTRRVWKRILGAVAFVAAWVVLALIADCNRVDSYAYITSCDCSWVPENTYCDFWAKVPREVMATRPSGKHPELLEGATEIHDHKRNPSWGCDDIVHTWQPASVDRDDHSDGDVFVLP